MLSVDGVTVRFGGITALEDVTLEARPGEVLGIIGPNGAGKTTLFNVVCGFVRAASGTLRWGEAPLDRIRPDELSRLGIARSLQGVGLFAHFTAAQNVMLGCERFRRAGWGRSLLGLPGVDRDEAALRSRAQVALERVGCATVADRLPGTLPYAVQKRVALARALAAEPELLLLDEPAGGLSASELDGLRELIDDLRGAMTVMLVEHHMDLVMSVCDRVVVLDFGRVVAAGRPEEVRSDPHVLDAYLGREATEGELSAAPGGDDARG